MSTHKYMDRICVAAVVLSLLVTLFFMNGEALGIQTAGKIIGYENRLFDTSRVHTIEIVMDDWEGFIETCQNEEYSSCNLVIDGESYKNVGIRGKGNTSGVSARLPPWEAAATALKSSLTSMTAPRVIMGWTKSA